MEIKIIDKILSQKCFWTIIFTCWVFIGIIVSIFDSSLKHNYIYVFWSKFSIVSSDYHIPKFNEKRNNP